MRFANRFRAEDDERRLATYLARWVWSSQLGVPSPSLVPLMATTGGVLVNANYAVKTGGEFRDIYAASLTTQGIGFTWYGGVTPYVWQYASNATVAGASPLTDVDATPGSLREFKERTRWL